MYKFLHLISCLLLSFSLAINAFGAEKQPKTTKQTKAISVQKKTDQYLDIATSFEPPQTLPPNFLGHSLKQAIAVAESVSKDLKKDQFESTDAYKARIANLDTIITPLSMKKSYVFKEKAYTEYDADSQILTADFVVSRAEWSSSTATIISDIENIVTGSYVGMNNYGAKKDIEKRTTNIYQIEFPQDQYIEILNSNLANTFKEKSRYDDMIRCKVSIPIQPDFAKSEIGNLSFLFVVGLRSPILTVSSENFTPEMSDPVDRTNVHKRLQVELKAAYLFSSHSGQIFAKFNEDSDSQKLECH